MDASAVIEIGSVKKKFFTKVKLIVVLDLKFDEKLKLNTFTKKKKWK